MKRQAIRADTPSPATPRSAMFESVEVGHALSQSQFKRREPALRLRLLEAQTRLRASQSAVIVIVCGVETSGRNRVVNRLNSWLDPHGVQVTGHWHETDGEALRPPHWRYWRRLPARGNLGILFGAWYEQTIMDHASDVSDNSAFATELARVAEFERMLAEDGAIIIKFWFNVSKAERTRRMHSIRHKTGRKLSAHEKQYDKRFDRMLAAAEHTIQATDSGSAPWHLIDAADGHYRDMLAGQIIADSIEQALERPTQKNKLSRRTAPSAGKRITVLDSVDLSTKMPTALYESEMKSLSNRLNTLSWQANESGRSTVVVLEGWDGSGKGGAIRRLVTALDARLAQVIQTAAPSDEERAHHYLWRFWRHVPPAGYFTIYDRSWYGRVLVERVEGLATPQEWARAYSEINAFESHLLDHGICVIKFWMHVSQDEQLRRFQDRKVTPFKRYKLTTDDWRNRNKWHDYELAVDEMVTRTGTARSPWTLVAGNSKQYARVCVMRTLVERMEQAAEKS